MSKKIAVIVGSLRTESWNRKLAKEMKRLAPEGLSLQIVEIGDLPLYNEDIDGDTPPEEYKKFRSAIKGSDGVLIVSPEYNRTIPGALKNAIDVGSRPYGKGVFQKKPAAVVTSSLSGMAGLAANHHIRQALVFVDMPAMQQPEAYIGTVSQRFDDKGRLNNDTEIFIKDFLTAFEEWVNKF